MKRGKTWFRVHVEILRSRKLQTLPAPLFKWIVNLWAAAAENGGIIPPAEDLAWCLREPIAKVEAAISQLREKGLIDEIDGSLVPHDWDEWQFESDVSTDRVKRYRERKRNVSWSVSGNVSETPSETDTETDTETEQTQTPSAAVQVIAPLDAKILETAQAIHERHPPVRRCGIGEVGKLLTAICNRVKAPTRIELLATIDQNHAAWCRTHDWQKDGGQFAKGLDNWLAPTKERYLTQPEPEQPGMRRPIRISVEDEKRSRVLEATRCAMEAQ